MDTGIDIKNLTPRNQAILRLHNLMHGMFAKDSEPTEDLALWNSSLLTKVLCTERSHQSVDEIFIDKVMAEISTNNN